MTRMQSDEKIAIIGLSCLFPGATNPDEYWHNLINGLNTTSLATEEQFGVNPDIYFDPQHRGHDTTYSLRGGYIRANIDIPAGMDRAAGWSLYTAQESLRDSGYASRADILARCGLILGNLSFPTQESHNLVAPVYNPALENAIAELTGIENFKLPDVATSDLTGDALRSPAAVVAEALGLGGIQFCLDAACASSLYAIGLASAYLLSGQTDLMLAGAVSAADPLFVNMGFTHFGAYPDKGASRPLDTHSEGLISGEGAGLLVLKRYSDALRDGDTIHAIVAGIGLSNDGRGKHPLTPNPRGQILAFQRAYQDRVDPSTIQYIECHASGTPLGDKTELQSMDEFFGAYNTTPLIGSVKANHGHLLTVAGLASILKVILSMQHSQIPATIGVENPLTSRRFGTAQIVRQNTSWPQVEKIAGVNAFGFGGVSAHLILENPAAAARTQSATLSPAAKTRLAIVGMDAQFGGCDGLEAFAQTLYDGTQHFTPLPPKRWKGLAGDAPLGAYIESFEIDFLRFKFPPKEDDQPTPQHLLLLKVADNAVKDAGLSEDSNVAVIVVLGNELSLHQYRSRLDLSWQIKDSLAAHGLHVENDVHDLETIVKDAISPPAQVNQYTSYIGNIVSSRVSALWNFSGPAFTMTAENSVYKALELAQILLADQKLDAVVIGAVDLAAGIESVLTRQMQHPINTGAATLSFDRDANGWQVGEGAGAIVLQHADYAYHPQVYATIESVSVLPGGNTSTVTQSIENALSAAGIRPDHVGYVEASASGIASEDAAEIAALNRVYIKPAESDLLPTALGSVKANIGHTGAASGIASLMKAALALGRRFIPATPKWSGPKDAAAWANSAFYVAEESRTWLTPKGVKRYAAVNGLGDDGTCAHVVLSDSGVQSRPQSGSAYLKRQSLHLFPFDADDQETLIGRLRQFENALEGDQSLSALAQTTFRAYRNGRYAVVIIGRDREALRKELKLAFAGIPKTFEQGGDWQTPAGSIFTANPLGGKGGVAFVYPGAFNSYPGHGRDWMHLFPESLDYVMRLSSDIPDQSSDVQINPRTFAAPTHAQTRALRNSLLNNQRAMMTAGTLYAVLYTHVMREVFKLQPDVTFGYSLGETSMLWAMGIWQNSDEARTYLRSSPLFDTRLAGRKDAIREAWGLPAHVDDDFWASYVLVASAASVYEQIGHETHVYLTHINTPTEVVVAGDPAACQRVIERLGCESIRAPFETVIHNEAIMSEYDEFYRLYNQAVNNIDDNITFYSAADYEPMRLDRELVARSVARMSCKQVDFPRLVHRAYRDGARIFIELGPAATCTRWINDTLRVENREHASMAIDNLRLNDHSALIKMLARLVSHRVPLDLSVLYDDDLPAQNGKHLLRTITLGGEPVDSVILSEKNRRRFAGRQSQPVAAQAAPVQREIPAPVLEIESQSQVAYNSHGALLQDRLAGLRDLGASLRAQVQNPTVAAPMIEAKPTARVIAPVQTRYTPRPALFDIYRIDQFARGSIKACFGPEYAIYDNQRAPRIPNTDLMLISRIVEIDAQRLITKTGSSMVAEYDVPADMWFYKDNSYPFTPYSMLMEMALQPCGFLSAYMGPTLAFPDIDFYFRNLDGQGKMLRDVDLRGRTLVNKVVMTSSTVLQGIIIQKFTFDMMLDGESFYVGSSTFGYFTLQALSSQAGLDMGKPPAKWHEANAANLLQMPGNRGAAPDTTSFMTLPSRQLAFLDGVTLDIHGGKYGQGYVYATNDVDPANWFFACHFHDDPVMPGSLGLEAIIQAIQAYAIQAGLGQGLTAARFAQVENNQTLWKYRGQVLNDSRHVNVEVHIKSVERTGSEINIIADASLWKDTLRIYEFTNMGVRLLDTAND